MKSPHCGIALVTCEPHGVCRSKRWRNMKVEGLAPQNHRGLGQGEAPPGLQLWSWPHPITEQENPSHGYSRWMDGGIDRWILRHQEWLSAACAHLPVSFRSCQTELQEVWTYHAGCSSGEDLQISESRRHEAHRSGQSIQSTQCKQHFLEEKKKTLYW